MQINKGNIESLKKVNIDDININSLVDINDVSVNKTLPTNTRLINFINDIKNPYCYKCGDTVIKVEFIQPEVTLKNRFENLIELQ